MLLKIYTIHNTVKIIDGIEDAEIHNAEYRFETWSEMYNSSAQVGGVRFHNAEPAIVSYDWKPKLPYEAVQGADNLLDHNVIKFVDILKNGEWSRIAIQAYAYLCNDEGKTVAKIGC